MPLIEGLEEPSIRDLMNDIIIITLTCFADSLKA